jgi:hypothetical protein
MLVIAAFRKLRQEDCEFEASLGSTERPCLKKSKPIKQKKQINMVHEKLQYNQKKRGRASPLQI